MPVIPSTTVPAPSGLDYTTDAPLLEPTKAQDLRNLLPGWTGVLRGTVSRRRLLPSPAGGTIDGLAYYYGPTAADDRLLWVTGGHLYSAPLMPGTPVPTLGSIKDEGGGFTPGVRVRWDSYEAEVVFVQADGGIN